MSDLLNTATGRNALLVAQKFQLERRLSKYFHRTIVIDVNDFHYGLNEFDLATMLGQLNVARDPEILELFSLLGAIGGLQHTVIDQSYYVNATTGSDVTGTGSVARPYASLWFLENLPRRIDHKVRIVLQTDVNASTYDLHLDFDFGNNGSFVILGQGAETFIGGSMLISDIYTLIGYGAVGAETAAAPPLGVDDSFMLANVFAVPIHDHFQNGLNHYYNVIPYPWNIGGVIVGNSMYVVNPTRNLTVRSITAQCTGNNVVGHSQLAILNLHVDFAVPPPGPAFHRTNPRFVWENKCDSTLSFVKFTHWWGAIASQPGARISGRINKASLLDHIECLNLADTGLHNLDNPNTDGAPFSPFICGARFCSDSGATHLNQFEMRGADIFAIDCAYGALAYAENQIEDCAFGQVQCHNANIYIRESMLDGIQTLVGTKDRGAIEGYSSIIDAQDCTILDSDNCVVAHSNCMIKISFVGHADGETNGTISNAGLYADGYNNFQLYYDDAGGIGPSIYGLTGAVADMIGVAIAGPVLVAYPGVETLTGFGPGNVMQLFR